MMSLSELNLAGNNILSIENLGTIIGPNIEFLELSENPIEQFHDKSFAGLKNLKYLNISTMNNLKAIDDNCLSELISLKVLICRENKKFNSFNFNQLQNLSHLKELDLSKNNLTSIVLNLQKENKSSHFEHLYNLKLFGNPWNCDCATIYSLEILISNRSHLKKTIINDKPRCENPRELSSKIIYSVSSNSVCKVPKRYQSMTVTTGNDAPQFLRPRYIMLTIITIVIVVILGFVVGCLIVCIKKRLRSNNFENSDPVRYSTVRNSNTYRTSGVHNQQF
jgi:Leucine rich repeat